MGYGKKNAAKNSEGEKRLFRAEARAGRSKMQKRKAKNYNAQRRAQPPSGATNSNHPRRCWWQAAMLFRNLVSPVKQSTTCS